LNEILRASPDVVLLDLDYTPTTGRRPRRPAPRSALDSPRRAHRRTWRGWLELCRATGAAAVVAKAATDEEAIRDLRVVLRAARCGRPPEAA